MLVGGTRDVRSEDEALAAFGLKRDEVPEDAHFDVWPENWLAVSTFAAMMTQWSYSTVGVVGLRYEALPTVLRLRGTPRSEWAVLFDQIRVMESEALKVLRKDG